MKNKVSFILGCLFLFLFLCLVYFSFLKLQDRVDIVVAKTDIRAKTAITSAMVDSRSIVSMDMPPGAITYDKVSQVIGKVPSADILKGEFMMSRKVGLEDENGQPLTVQNINAREVPIPLDGQKVFAGDLKKGDYVDIIASFKKGDALGTFLTKTVLQQVEVADTISGKDGKEYVIVVLGLEDSETLYFSLENCQHLGLVKASAGARITNTTGILPKLFLEKFGFIVTN